MKQRLLLWILLLPLVLCAQEKGEAMLSLDGEWQFKTDPNNRGEAANWFSPTFDDRGWDTMSVPGNWDLHNEYTRYAGKAWYRKKLVVPSEWRSRFVRILFEAVNNDSKVWLNGKLLGKYNLGFLPFEFDVSSLLNYGGSNTLVVCADNTLRRGALWNWGGIRRPVMAVATPKVYIQNLSITPIVDLSAGTSQVTVAVSVCNKTTQPVNVSGEVVLSSVEGYLKKLPFTANIGSGSQHNVTVTASIPSGQTHLWGFDDPFLYRCSAAISNSNGYAHQKTARFGLRKIEADNKNYEFRLNGKPVRLMGFNLVPDDRTTGSTLPLWRVKEDIDLMKSFGANMARLTHLPMHQEMLDYLDEKGILVIEEIPLWGFDAIARKNRKEPFEWLKRLITSHYNHPSVIGWSVGNEIGEVPGVMEYVDSAIRYVKSLDTFHYALMVSHTADRGRDPLQFSDFGLVNKYGKGIGMLAEKMHQLHPDKLLFYSEYGYGQLREDPDADVDAKGMMDSLRFRPYLMGGSLWTFNDYRSSYIGTKEFSENRPWGVVDVFRQKKKAFYSFRKEYAPVREMSVSLLAGDDISQATVKLVPRLPFDLPAYEMREYLLAWKGFDEEGKVIAGSFRQLPVINPGDKEIVEKITWEKSPSLASLQVELISPLNYSVYDTIIHFKKPATPAIRYIMGVRTEMNDIRPNSGALRVVMEKPGPTTSYIVRYSHNGQTKETRSTRNHFIDIPGLSFGESYEVSVSSVNAFGESEPTTPKNVRVETGAAPPVIYYTEPADKGIFIGYMSQSDDYMYVVQYTTTTGNFEKAFTIQSRTKGVMLVPGLKNGQPYTFRMKIIKQNNDHTAWSEEHTVTPDGHQVAAAPELQGVLRNEGKALFCFKPVKKATGYTIQYRPDKDSNWQSVEVTAAQLNNYLLEGLDKHTPYQFRIRARNQNGYSLFSNSVKK